MQNIEIMDHGQRETQKANAWDIYRSSATPEQQATAMCLIMEAHFARNPESGSIQNYAPHWGYAQQFNFSKDAVVIFRKKYPLKVNPKIELGFTDWNSFNKKGYGYERESIMEKNGLTKIPIR